MTDTNREALIKQLLEGQQYEFNTGELRGMSSVMDDAANMLEADAQQIDQLKKNVALEQTLGDIHFAARKRLEAQQVAVPAGFVLVPLEPTPEMIAIGGHVNSEWLNDNAPIGERRYAMPMKSVYEAMLAAAPQPPQGDKT